MKSCKRCGSYAINHSCHGRDGSDPDLCDVCYWRSRADQLKSVLVEARDDMTAELIRLEDAACPDSNDRAVAYQRKLLEQADAAIARTP